MKYSPGIGILVLGFTVLASAHRPLYPYKVYGKVWGYANNWRAHTNTCKTKFLNDAKPKMNVTFDANAKHVIAYPAFIRGWHYNINPIPTDKSLPQVVSKLSKIPVKLRYKVGGSNVVGDFAYDIFLRKDTLKTTPQLEVMIWGDHNSWPIGKKSGNNVIRIGGRTFDLWEGKSGAGYYAYSFVPHGTVASPGERQLVSAGRLNLDLKKIFNWLQANKASDGHYSDNMYLHAVEAGFEILNGHGWAYLTGSIDLV